MYKKPMKTAGVSISAASETIAPRKQDVVSAARLVKKAAELKAEAARQQRIADEASRLGVPTSTVTVLREMLQQLEEAGLGNALVRVNRSYSPVRRAGEPGRSDAEKNQLRGIFMTEAEDSDSAGNLLDSDLPVVVLSNEYPRHLRPELTLRNRNKTAIRCKYEDEDDDELEEDEDEEDEDEEDDDEE